MIDTSIDKTSNEPSLIKYKKWRKVTLVVNLIPGTILFLVYIGVAFQEISKISRDDYYADSPFGEPGFVLGGLVVSLIIVILINLFFALFAAAAREEPACGALIYSGIASLGIYLSTIHIYWLAIAIPFIVIAFVNTQTWCVAKSINQSDNEH